MLQCLATHIRERLSKVEAAAKGSVSRKLPEPLYAASLLPEPFLAAEAFPCGRERLQQWGGSKTSHC